MVVVAEPSDLEVIVAHKGFDYYRVEVGRRLGPFEPPNERGERRLQAARIITAIEQKLISRAERRSHPLLGSASLNVSAVIGYARNEATTALRRGPGKTSRPAPLCRTSAQSISIAGASPAKPRASPGRVEGFLDELRQEDDKLVARLHFASCPEPPIRIRRSKLTGPPLVSECLRIASEEAGIEARPKGVPFWSDAALFNSIEEHPVDRI